MSSAIGSRFVGSEFVDSNPKTPRFITNGRSTGPESPRIVGNGIDTRLSSRLVSAVDRKLEAARQKDLTRYGELVRQSVDGKLTAKQTDELADVVIRLGLRLEQIDQDAADYKHLLLMAGRDFAKEADEAQRLAVEATTRLKQIEQVEVPQLRKQAANGRTHVATIAAERQKIETIKLNKPWLVAPAEQTEK